MTYTDIQIREAVDVVFQRFDKDGNNLLDQSEIKDFLGYALKKMHSTRPPSDKDVNRFLQKNDKSHDGKINKMEMFALLKSTLNGGQWFNLACFGILYIFLIKFLESIWVDPFFVRFTPLTQYFFLFSLVHILNNKSMIFTGEFNVTE